MSNNQIAVFLGPSCNMEEAKKYLKNADYYAPAARGSFYNIINDGYRIIVLIDGLFYGSLSLWHKEIIYALDSGIEVIGASSMGALRAAELQGTNIIGVGTIFNWYRDGVIDGDDEVALLHGGSESHFVGLTIPLVNLRWNLIKAVSKGLISKQEEAMIIGSAKQLCFTERTIEKIFNPLKENFDIYPVKAWLNDNWEDLKKMDAIQALKLAGERQLQEPISVIPIVREYEIVHINVGIEYYKSERMTSIKAKHGDSETPLVEYAKRISANDPAYRDLVRARSYQRLIVGWARELRLDDIKSEDLINMKSNWSPETIDFEHRRATGLTLIDIAREHQDAILSLSLQQQFCGEEVTDVVRALDEWLKDQRQESPIDWMQMIDLNGKLIYTLWRLGQKKNIMESLNGLEQNERNGNYSLEEPQKQVEKVIDFTKWIDKMGTAYFGYTLDATKEILLAYQYLNCLKHIPTGAQE
jgi:hypothetical protein